MTASTKKITIFLAAFLMLFTLAAPTYAQINPQNTGLTETAREAGLGEEPVSLPLVVGRVISIAFGLLGLLVAIFIIYGGFIWLTARGDTAKVQKAQSMITQAVIGAFIVLAAYSITYFVIQQAGGTISGESNATTTTTESPS